MSHQSSAADSPLYQVITVCALLVTGCGHLQSVPEGAASELQGHTATVVGCIADSSLMQDALSTLEVYKIAADGRLEGLPAQTVSAVRDGCYRLDIPASSLGSDLLVRVTSGVGSGMIVVSTQKPIGDTVWAQPIGPATTLRASVFLAAKADGVWPVQWAPDELEPLIGTDLANLILADQKHYAASLSIVEAAAVAAANSFSLAWKLPGEPATAAASDCRRLWFDASLGISGAAVIKGANGSFGVAVAAVDRLSTAEVAQVTAATEAAVEAFETYSRRLPGPIAAQAMIDMEMRRALATRAQVNLAVSLTSGASARSRASALSTTLLAQLAAAANSSQPAQTLIDRAWTSYCLGVRAALTEARPSRDIGLAEAQRVVGQTAAAAKRRCHAVSPAPPAVTAGAISQSIRAIYAAAAAQAASLEMRPSDALAAYLAALGTLELAG